MSEEDMQDMITIMIIAHNNAPSEQAKAFRKSILDTLQSGELPQGQGLEGLATLVYMAGRQDVTMKLAHIYDSQQVQQ